MRLPIKNKQPSQILSLLDLAGGLNMRDGISEVLDNQLTDCKNMWWFDGVLRTRAGMLQNSNTISLGDSGTNKKPKIRQHNCYNYSDNAEGQLCSVVYSGKINFFWNYGDNVTAITSITEESTSYFVCQKSKELYCFTSNKTIYKFDMSAEKSKWEKVENTYIPKVMIQCKKLKSAKATSSEVNGVMIEGYNLLSDYYEMSYNSYNPEIVKEEDQKHKMQYHLLKRVDKYEISIEEKEKGEEPVIVKAIFTYNGTPCEHKVEISEDSRREGKTTTWEEAGPNKDDKLLMRVWKNRISFYYCDENTDEKFVTDKTKYKNVATISENDEEDYWRNSDTEEEKAKPTAPVIFADGGEDDIVIIAPYVWKEEKDKVFKMTQCEWFGGGSEGLSGGTRLFLCGNSKNNNADLVVWSGLNNPLYFPENSYFYVGNETGAVTGFGKQADKLFIFKEYETWFTEYRQNTNITAEDLINQNVIDYASSSVYFPLTQVNSSIGCPYPDTIQLCRNRLVWLGNNNNVYTLVSESQYNERSIFSVSEMVKRKIQEIGAIDTVSACDWDGYYCLLLGDNIFLMDYNCYGYTHVASYSKTEDANIKIPWYLWEVPKGKSLSVFGDKLTALDISVIDNKYQVESFYFDQRANKDKLSGTESEIVSSFTTKIFDFGLPHIRKNIEQLNLQLGNNDGEAINLHLITENGTEEEQAFTDGADTQSYTAGYITSRAVFPCIKQVLRLGLKFESKGTLAVDSVILKYRTLGGAR